MPPNTTPARTSFHVAHRHAMAAYMRKSVVVRMSVPVTASPYAVASLFDDRKTNMSTSTPPNSSQLTAGT